jgi:hypothetical protein
MLRRLGGVVASDAMKQKPGVKRLTKENWLTPDVTGRAFVEVNAKTGATRPATGDGWAEQFLAVDLGEHVPMEVRDMWEVARGTLLYGWFYYPLYALGEHELRRVADAATLHCYRHAGGPPLRKPDCEGKLRWPTFRARVAWLIGQGILPRSAHGRWEAIVELRNEGSHASFRHLVMPTDALQVLGMLASEIDALFANGPDRCAAGAL